MSKHRWDLVGHYANFGRPMSKDRLLFAGGVREIFYQGGR